MITIQFHLVEGGIVTLRPEFIIGWLVVRANVGNAARTFTRVMLMGGDAITVTEPPEQAEQMIRQVLTGSAQS